MEVIEARCKHACKFEQAISLLKARDMKDRILGVEVLRALNDKKAVPYLVAALKMEFKKRTGLAAWIIPTLGALRDSSAVPILIQSSNVVDESWLWRVSSVEAMGNIGASVAIPALIRASTSGETRDVAIRSLAKFKDSRVIPVLISAIQPEEDEETRKKAMEGLRALGKHAVPNLIRAFESYSPEHPDTKRRLWLCQLLRECSDERAMLALRKSLNDPDEIIRRCVAEALGE